MHRVVSSTNEDLIWGLEQFNQRQWATDFLLKFENRFCVYSHSVEQLYTNYSMNFPKRDATKVVILPDPYAFHDTYSRVNPEAIFSTGLHIFPGEMIGADGLFLAKSKHGKPDFPSSVPFKVGLKRILSSCGRQDPFLPLLMKGDLREFEEKLPSLHLHRVSLQRLMHLSDFDRHNIKTVISEKLLDIYRHSESPTLLH